MIIQEAYRDGSIRPQSRPLPKNKSVLIIGLLTSIVLDKFNYLSFSLDRTMQTTATMVPKSTAAPMARRVTSRASIPISILEGDKEDFWG